MPNYPRHLRKEDLEAFESLLTEIPTSSRSLNSFHIGQPSNPLSSNIRGSGDPHPQASAYQSVASHDQEVFTTYLFQPWRSNLTPSVNQGDIPGSSVVGKALAGKDNQMNENWNETKGKGIYHEGQEHHQKITAKSSSLAEDSDYPDPLSSTSLGIARPGKSVPQSWEIANTQPEKQKRPGNSLPPPHQDSFEAEDYQSSVKQNNLHLSRSIPGTPSTERNDCKPALHTFDLLTTADSGARHEDTDSDWEIDLVGPRAIFDGPRGEQRNEECATNLSKVDVDDLTTLLSGLSLQNKAAYFSVILQVCDEIQRSIPCDGGDHNSQTSSTTLNGNSSQHSSRSSNKRPRQTLEDSDMEEHGLKKLKSIKARAIDSELRRFLACPFYKVNPHIYSSCSDFKAGTISRIGSHLRDTHTKGYYCTSCYTPFRDAQEIVTHEARESYPSTRGLLVAEMKIPKTKGKDVWERWYWIWSKLFPTLLPPADPWWSTEPTLLQFGLSLAKRLEEQDKKFSSKEDSGLWTKEFVSQWATSLPEHLPDLIHEMIPHRDSNKDCPKCLHNLQILSASAHPSQQSPRTFDLATRGNTEIKNAQVNSLEKPLSYGSQKSGTASGAELPASSSIEVQHSGSTRDENMTEVHNEATPLLKSDEGVQIPTNDVPDLNLSDNVNLETALYTDTTPPFLYHIDQTGQFYPFNSFYPFDTFDTFDSFNPFDQNFMVGGDQPNDWDGATLVHETNPDLSDLNTQPSIRGGASPICITPSILLQGLEPVLGDLPLDNDFSKWLSGCDECHILPFSETE